MASRFAELAAHLVEVHDLRLSAAVLEARGATACWRCEVWLHSSRGWRRGRVMTKERDEALALLEACERAERRGLVREFQGFEPFAAVLLALIDQPDTPVNRAKLGFGSPGAVTPLMAGAENRSYFLVVIPPTPPHEAGAHFFIEHPESEARSFVVVVSEDREREMVAKRLTMGRES